MAWKNKPLMNLPQVVKTSTDQPASLLPYSESQALRRDAAQISFKFYRDLMLIEGQTAKEKFAQGKKAQMYHHAVEVFDETSEQILLARDACRGQSNEEYVKQFSHAMLENLAGYLIVDAAKSAEIIGAISAQSLQPEPEEEKKGMSLLKLFFGADLSGE
jgi:hypothetical protein